MVKEMAHYAFLDENNIVVQVIVGKDEGELGNDGVAYDWEEYYGEVMGYTCKRTSYNTKGGVHVNGGTPFRKNYAGIGFIYDPVRDAFYRPQPWPSWIFNEDTCQWDPPVPNPRPPYMKWDEATLSWIEI
jgi:hypothetical protein